MISKNLEYKTSPIEGIYNYLMLQKVKSVLHKYIFSFIALEENLVLFQLFERNTQSDIESLKQHAEKKTRKAKEVSIKRKMDEV